MSQRNLFPGPQTPTSDDERIWNHHPHPDAHLPSDNNTRNSAVLRPAVYPATNFPIYATRPPPPHDPYYHHLPSSTNSTTTHFHPDHYSYGPQPGSNIMVHPHSETRASGFKRKTPDIPLPYNGNSYSAASSSNPLHHHKPIVMHQYNSPLDPDSAQRNVRARHFNPHTPSSSSSNMSTPHHFRSDGYLTHEPSTLFHYPQPVPNNSAPNSTGAFHSMPSNSSGYNPYYHAGSSQAPAAGPPGMEPSRSFRPLHITGRSGYRNGRPRTRFHDGYVDDASRTSRWSSEGPMVYYSRNLFDQHRDMRLDIDSMTYEELLALGERIGHVNTGLSDETVSNCLERTSYSYSAAIKGFEEEKCVICLEEYKAEERLAKLTCRHEFHVSCIKNWLQIKNSCPICKATAFGDASIKGKHL